MSETQADRRLLADLLAEAAHPGTGEHLELEELACYRDGALDAASERRVQDHLVYCRQCAGKLLDLERLAGPDPGPPRGAADFEVAAAWRELERRAGTRGGGAGGQGWRWLAAGLAVALVGLAFATWKLSGVGGGEPPGLARLPRANPTIVYYDAVTRSDPRPDGVAGVESGADFLVVFAPETLEEFEDYGVAIRGADGVEVWRGSGLRLTGHGTLRLGIPAGFLAAGEYSIRFDGLRVGRTEVLGEHSLAVRAGS